MKNPKEKMKKQRGRLISKLLLLFMLLIGFGLNEKQVLAQENLTQEYMYDGYKVSITVTDKWECAFSAEVEITNTGKDPINDWAVQFDFDREILYTWDGTILQHTGNTYAVRNYDWNANIKPGESAGFGMMVQCEEEIVFPGNFSFVMTKENVNEPDYSAEFVLYSDWGDGSNAALILTNLTEEKIENWELEFDYGREIEEISNAEIVSYEAGHYIIKNAGYNADITKDNPVHITIVTGKGEKEECPVNFIMRKTVVGEPETPKKATVEEVRTLWNEKRYYPIEPGSDEWNQYGLVELVAILNPPEEVLDSFATEELATLMMEYPYLWLLTSYEYENRDYFFDFVEANCDIYNELLRREDGIECLLKDYRETDFDAAFYNADPYVVWGYNPKANAEVFACQTLVHLQESGKISGKEYELYTTVVNEKKELYEALEDGISKMYLSFDKEEEESTPVMALPNAEEPVLFAMRTADGFTATGEGNETITRKIEEIDIVFTPGTYRKYGVSENCFKWKSGGYEDTDRIKLERKIEGRDDYTTWYRLSRPSPKYNCHAYAWLNANASNGYWLDKPYAYMGAVTHKGYNAALEVGDVIVMYNKNTGALVHSAVICEAPAGATEPYTMSKYGGCGLYVAPLSGVLMYYTSENYDVYRLK